MGFFFNGFSYKNKIIFSIIFSFIIIIALLSRSHFKLQNKNQHDAREKIDRLTERIEIKTKLFFNTLKMISVNPMFTKSSLNLKVKKTLKSKDILLALSSVRDVLQASYIYILDRKGNVIISTRTKTGKTLFGNNYSFRPYFKKAIKGEPYIYSALGVTTAKLGVYFSYPIYFSGNKDVQGVIVLKKNLSDFDILLSTLGKDTIAGILSNDNIIISTNKKDWLYKYFGQLARKKQIIIKESKQFVGKKINSLPFHFNDSFVTINNNEYVFEKKQIVSHHWKIFLLHKISYEEWYIKAVSIILFVILLELALIFFFFNKRKNETFQKKSRKDIQKIRELSQAIEQSTASIVITDVDGNIEFVNSAFSVLSGYTREEALGKNPRVLKSHYHDKEFFKDLWNTISSGKSWKGDIKNKAKDGSLYWESATISPIFNEHGTIIKYIAVKDDISDKKNIEKELKRAKEFAERANKAKSEFLANMSHELRTPLNSVLGFAQILQMDAAKEKLSERQNGFINIILKSGEHLLEMINSILDLAKIEAGRLDLTLEIFDFHNTISSVLLSIQPLVQKKQLVLEEDIQLENSLVYADSIKIKQILYNFLSNAIKFTPKGGRIGIRVSSIKNDLIITIWDEGIGISKENQKNIFQAFEQVGEKKEEGTGLGLVISKRLVELHDGIISFKSEIDKGSEFKIIIPACLNKDSKSNLKAVSVENSKETISPKINKTQEMQTILVVDDNKNNLLLIEEMFKLLEYSVTTVSSGEEAIEKCKHIHYNLIFMDIDMPGISGVVAMNEIKKIDKEVCFTALTAFAMKDDKAKFINLGFDEYLSKPVKLEQLKEVLGKIFSTENKA